MAIPHTIQFTEARQNAFAVLSGDANPIHVDPEFARQTTFGNRIIHGIHLLLQAIERIAEELDTSFDLEKCRVDFPQAAFVNDTVTYSLDLNPGKRSCRINGETENGRTCLQGRIQYDLNDQPDQVEIPGGLLKPEIQTQSFEEFAQTKGIEELLLDRDQCHALLPNLTQFIQSSQLAALLAATRVVGMRAPGMNSLLGSIRLKHQPDNVGSDLSYKTAHCNYELSFGTLKFVGAGSVIEAGVFYRPGQIRQPSFSEIRCAVPSTQFANQHALVIGGSRGLGEVASRLLAAGGASVQLSYYSAEKRAEAVAEDIRSGGGEAAAFQHNVLDPGSALSPNQNTKGRDLTIYYFATPAIFTCGDRFDPAAFEHFAQYYVSGISRLIATLPRKRIRGLFYPSTVAIDDLPPRMAEYASSKYAGELLCAALEKQYNIIVHIARLPRMLTDQTATPGVQDVASPVQVLTEEITSFQQKLALKPHH